MQQHYGSGYISLNKVDSKMSKPPSWYLHREAGWIHTQLDFIAENKQRMDVELHAREHAKVWAFISLFSVCGIMHVFRAHISPMSSSRGVGGVVTSEDGKQGSGPPKPRCEARLHSTEVVIAVSQTIRSGHGATPRRMYAFHRHGALLVVTV
jgi:hypothetical protein